MTKPIIVVKVPCKLLYIIQVKEFLIKCSTSWPYLISEFLVAYITIVASDWPRTFFTPEVFLFSINFTQKTISALYHHLRKQLISHKHNMTLECIMLTICIHVYVAILREGSPHDGETSV